MGVVARQYLDLNVDDRHGDTPYVVLQDLSILGVAPHIELDDKGWADTPNSDLPPVSSQGHRPIGVLMERKGHAVASMNHAALLIRWAHVVSDKGARTVMPD